MATPVPPPRPLTITERRNLKRELGRIADRIHELDRAERQLHDERRELRREQARISAEVYRA